MGFDNTFDSKKPGAGHYLKTFLFAGVFNILKKWNPWKIAVTLVL